jgi:L-threonylcarbamoyladenylate synthase
MRSFENDIKKCIEVLKNGGLILYPTDTIWGIGCDATNEDAVAKIFTLKKRDDSKALVTLVAEERDINKYITQPDPAVFDFLDSATKPLTVIYDGATMLAENLLGANGSAAIRVVKDDFCKMLIKRFGKPIVSTSANISGEASPANFTDISPEIKTGVDYVVQHRQDDINNGVASTIVKLNRDGTVTTIRS